MPFAAGATPGRPSPGNLLGNQVTLAGTDRFLKDAVVFFGAGRDVAGATFNTVTLYRNDGPGGAPGSIIANSTIGPVPALGQQFVFPFATFLPYTLTVVVSSSYVQGGSQGFTGPVTTTTTPVIGNGVNGIWYNTS